MNELVTINEVRNDGKTIHLYFNGLVGLFTAYGYSAFLLNKETKVNAAYSDSMQMPVVVINAEHLKVVIEKLKVVCHKDGYYCLAVENAVIEDEYAEWTNSTKVGGGIKL